MIKKASADGQTEHIIYSFNYEQENTFIEDIWSA